MVKEIKRKATVERLRRMNAMADAATHAPTIARIRTKAEEITVTVRERLGDRITPELFARGILFEAAYWSVQHEDMLRALVEVGGMVEEQHQDLRRAVKLGSVAKKADDAYNSFMLPLAKRGAAFVGQKRGISRLSREILAVLDRKGKNLSAKLLIRELENKGVIRDENSLLKWEQRKGTPKTTSKKQFENNVSRLRKHFR